MITGGCFCGHVRYEADGELFHETICHCEDCRRAVGAHVVAWFSVKRASFRWTGTAPQAFRSSPKATRRFCGACGTSLTFEGDASPDEFDLTISSLDSPSDVAPRDHVYVRSKLAWDPVCDGLPQYATTRAQG